MTNTRPSDQLTSSVVDYLAAAQRRADERMAANRLEVAGLIEARLGPVHAMDPQLALRAGQLTADLAAALAAAEDRGPDGLRHTPTMELVTELVAPDAGDSTTRRGLRCPHCQAVAWDGGPGEVYVIDRSERWSRFGFQIDLVDQYEEVPRSEGGTTLRRTGRQVEQMAVVGGYADSDHQGVGYACGACERRVALPADVDEEGI